MGSTGVEAVEVSRLRSGLRQSLDALRSVAVTDDDVRTRVLPMFEEMAGRCQSALATALPSPAVLAEAEGVISEAVECVAGVAVAAHGLGGRNVPVARAWLDRLSERAKLPAVGLVIPATLEYYGARADIVRLRVPDDGIWGLPVAVHEYGHFLATRLRVRRTAADGLPETAMAVEDLLLKAARDDARPRLFRLGHELFADALAVLVAGPAYGFYVFRHRFLPDLPHADLHPSWARRAQVVLASLDRLAAGSTDLGLGRAAARAAALWVHGDPDPADGLSSLGDELVTLTFENPELARITYGAHAEASRLVAELRAGPATSDDAAAVVNAAWLLRVGIEAAGGSDPAAVQAELAAVEQRAFAGLLAAA